MSWVDTRAAERVCGAARDRSAADLEQAVHKLAGAKAELAAEHDRRAAAEARVHELERELARRGKDRKPSPRTPPAGANDRRKRGKRKHPGSTRPPADPAAPDADARAEDVPAPDHCLFCGGEVEDTGAFDERVVEDIPQPKREVTIYRRRVCRCNQCGRLARGRADLDVPGSRLGPRARLLAAYGRVGLGVSLGKTQQLLAEFFGLHVSRAGLLGLQEWTAAALAPVAQRLLELLRESPVVQADETSWPQNGKYVWCWVLSNPKLAVFLIERRRDRATFRRLLGDSFAGTLVTDFYAVYDGLAPRQQRCLAHLAVTLRELLEKTPAKFAAPNLQPILDWVAECFAFARDRVTLAFDASRLRANVQAAAEIRRPAADVPRRPGGDARQQSVRTGRARGGERPRHGARVADGSGFEELRDFEVGAGDGAEEWAKPIRVRHERDSRNARRPPPAAAAVRRLTPPTLQFPPAPPASAPRLGRTAAA